jgi:hypothetical protein
MTGDLSFGEMAVILAAIVIGLFAGWWLFPASADPVNPVRTVYLPCPTDEGDGNSDCVYDARHQGNGLGNSFYVGEGGKVSVLPHHIAHHLLFYKEGK